MELSVFHPAFHAQDRISGHKGRSLDAIEDSSSARVDIHQDYVDAPIFLTVSASRKEYCNRGIDLCKDLVSTIHGEYLDWLCDRESSFTRFKNQTFPQSEVEFSASAKISAE